MEGCCPPNHPWIHTNIPTETEGAAEEERDTLAARCGQLREALKETDEKWESALAERDKLQQRVDELEAGALPEEADELQKQCKRLREALEETQTKWENALEGQDKLRAQLTQSAREVQAVKAAAFDLLMK